MEDHTTQSESRGQATAEPETLSIVYRFDFQDEHKKFEVVLDAHTLKTIQRGDFPKHEWTKLKFSQCENCPLGDSVEYCPVAVNLSRLVEEFQNRDSFEQANVTVDTPQRSYVKKTSLQKALSSIIGIYMVTSDCPVMDKLRPMTP